tara:strand:- start:2524 stop:3306 length:783 start_codon:yes stop_codon:yes gene_type:complete
MQFSVTLPNKKEVIVKELLLKDLRYLSLYAESSVAKSIKFLESFICTKNLNVLEKFLALLLLRKQCIGDFISLGSDKASVKMSLGHILTNIKDIGDIKHTFTLNDVTYVLNYPTQFNLGDHNSILSVIESIQIKDEKILVSELTDAEFIQLINTLPTKLFSHIKKYMQQYKHFFTINLWNERKKLNIQEGTEYIFSKSFSSLVIQFFNIATQMEYRELIFVVSKRVPDGNFIINSTYKDVDQYLALYKGEIARQNDALKT